MLPEGIFLIDRDTHYIVSYSLSTIKKKKLFKIPFVPSYYNSAFYYENKIFVLNADVKRIYSIDVETFDSKDTGINCELGSSTFAIVDNSIFCIFHAMVIQKIINTNE